MKCESYQGRRNSHAEPITLDGKIEIVKQTSNLNKRVKIKVADGQIIEGEIVE